MSLSPATTREPATRTDATADRLRADILAGRLAPGERLKFPLLTAQYGASVGALREILTRLEAEGLVRARPRLGFTVTPLSHEDLADLTDARMAIEPLVFERSLLDGDMRWEAGTVAALHVMERTPMFDPDDPGHPDAAWSAAHAAFHEALLAGCGNRRLLATAASLRREAELYLHWSVAFGREPDRDIAGEHRALLDAAIARDTAAGPALLREHISHTARLVIDGAPDAPNTAPAG